MYGWKVRQPLDVEHVMAADRPVAKVDDFFGSTAAAQATSLQIHRHMPDDSPTASFWQDTTYTWSSPNSTVSSVMLASGPDLVIKAGTFVAGQRYVVRVRAVQYSITSTVSPGPGKRLASVKGGPLLKLVIFVPGKCAGEPGPDWRERLGQPSPRDSPHHRLHHGGLPLVRPRGQPAPAVRLLSRPP